MRYYSELERSGEGELVGGEGSPLASSDKNAD